MAVRFLDLAALCETLSISMAQARALVRSGEIPAIQIGGRGQWRIEVSVLEDYIQRKYQENEERLAEPEPQPETESEHEDERGTL